MAINRIKTGGITDNTIQSGDLAPGTIASDRIAPGTIANDRLANNTITINGTSIALGASGDIVAGTDWQSVKTADFTAVAGEGYFIDTTSSAVTVTLPTSPSAGDTVVLKDYARTWGTNNVTLASALMDGSTDQNIFSTSGQTATLVYMDGTRGWSLINDDTTSKLEVPPTFISATGGTVTESGDFKIHTFTGDGCFVVSTAGNVTCNPAGGPSVVDYLVVAGGGGGGRGCSAGGGGAGGYRESHSVPVSGCYTASPLATCTGITVTATTYPITVGGGGAGSGPGTTCIPGCSGSNSVFSTITSTGGGYGGGFSAAGDPGGSGGGGGHSSGSGGCGNTPPVSPPQGNNGADSQPATGPAPSDAGGGGGGATATGVPGTTSHAGGAGATTSISGSPTAYAGGGGGSNRDAGGEPDVLGGTGGGGRGAYGTRPRPLDQATGQNGTSNTGGAGGGGGRLSAGGCVTKGGGGTGGKGIVILKYKFQ